MQLDMIKYIGIVFKCCKCCHQVWQASCKKTNVRGWINIFCRFVFISFLNQMMYISILQSNLLQLLYIASAFGFISWSTSLTRSKAPIWVVNWPHLLGPDTEWTSFLLCTPSREEIIKSHMGQGQGCREGGTKPWPCAQPNSLSLL